MKTTITSLGGRLAEERRRLGLKQDELAEACNTTRETIGRYERNVHVPNADAIKALSLAGINTRYVVIGPSVDNVLAVGEPDVDGEPEGPHDTADTDQKLRSEYVYIPLYDVSAAAGAGAVVEREKVMDVLAFKEQWIRTELHAHPRDLYLLWVEGESMEPTLRPGDILLVDHREAGSVPRDGIYVLRMDDALLVKRLQRLPGGEVRVSSDNAAYEPFTFNLNNPVDAFSIIGRVVWTGRRM